MIIIIIQNKVRCIFIKIFKRVSKLHSGRLGTYYLLERVY